MEEVRSKLQELFPNAVINVRKDERNILHLTGTAESWNQVVEIGHKAAETPNIRNVVNDIEVPGLFIPKRDYKGFAQQGYDSGKTFDADIIIIGAGVSGSGIARELSKYNKKIIVVERGEDVAVGSSKANNGHIHPGNSVKPGTLKAKLNVEGNQMYTKWAEELDFVLQRVGTLGVFTDEQYRPGIEQGLAVAKLNGVESPEIIDPEKVFELEPQLKIDNVPVKGALWMPSTGLVEPYQVTVALAENAASNGVEFLFECEVGEILTKNGKVTGVVTSKGIINAGIVINAAGVYADQISEMAGDKSYTIHTRRGALAILDTNKKPLYNRVTVVLGAGESVNKNKESKGGLMGRTPDFNIFIGPSTEEVPDREDVSTFPDEMAYTMGLIQAPNIGYGDIIRMFSGLRAADYMEDFIVEMSDVTSGFVNVGGMQSPGLAAAPAVAKMVEGIVKDYYKENEISLEKNPTFNPIRKGHVVFHKLSREEQDKIVQENPSYGNIICRCESITEGEIVEAIHSPIVPVSVDAIKRRTRAGMGRCQGGFCQPKVLNILARELQKNQTEITLKGSGSQILEQDSRKENHHENN